MANLKIVSIMNKMRSATVLVFRHKLGVRSSVMKSQYESYKGTATIFYMEIMK